jgi:hypothetical protein
VAETARHRPRSQRLGERRGGLDAVLEGNDHRPGTDEWPKAWRQLPDLPGLHADENRVERRASRQPRRFLRDLGTDRVGAPGAVDAEPSGLDGREVLASRHEGDVVPGLGEQPPEDPSDPSGSDHRDAHSFDLPKAGAASCRMRCVARSPSSGCIS